MLNLNSIWRSDMNRRLKVNFFKAAVESILLYGSECWTLTKEEEHRSDGCYTRLLRHASASRGAIMSPTKNYTETYRRSVMWCGDGDSSLRATVHAQMNSLQMQCYGNRMETGIGDVPLTRLLEKDTGLCTQELRTAMLSRTNWWYHVMGSGEQPDWLIVNKINGKMWDDIINSLICIISTVQEMFRWKLQKFRMSYLPYPLSDWHQFFPLLFEVFLLFLLN